MDVCALSRPFDDQHQARIRLETAAVELILANVRQSKLELVVSPTHIAEINAISDKEERKQLLLLLKQLGKQVSVDLLTTRKRAEQIVLQKLGIGDAAHIAFAEQFMAEFITVDDRLLKQCHRVKPNIWFGTPLAYCEKENLK